MLAGLKGIGPETATVLWSEGLFRPFDNRRQVAAYAGLAPTPWQSGSIDHEQGVSKAGNPRLRTTMVELAWLWLKNQPTSALSLWFHERVRLLGGRMRKTTIVALARKLLIALWRYTTAGVVIEAAVGLNSRPTEWSRPPEPHPPDAGCWCSRNKRRPYVSLIWCSVPSGHANGLRLGFEATTGELPMNP